MIGTATIMPPRGPSTANRPRATARTAAPTPTAVRRSRSAARRVRPGGAAVGGAPATGGANRAAGLLVHLVVVDVVVASSSRPRSRRRRRPRCRTRRRRAGAPQWRVPRTPTGPSAWLEPSSRAPGVPSSATGRPPAGCGAGLGPAARLPRRRRLGGRGPTRRVGESGSWPRPGVVGPGRDAVAHVRYLLCGRTRPVRSSELGPSSTGTTGGRSIVLGSSKDPRGKRRAGRGPSLGGAAGRSPNRGWSSPRRWRMSSRSSASAASSAPSRRTPSVGRGDPCSSVVPIGHVSPSSRSRSPCQSCTPSHPGGGKHRGEFGGHTSSSSCSLCSRAVSISPS